MMKGISIIKRILTIGLIFLISINSFAAIVSDDDGSAFVTKAEFDTLKNNFNKQIDDYNGSIDGKIDGAIASYLTGIKLTEVWHLKPIFNSFGVTTIASKRNTDIAWTEDLQGWNCKAFYYSYYDGAIDPTTRPAGYECVKGGTVAWNIAPVAGKRWLYTEEIVGGAAKWRWAGYATNFKQTNDAELVAGAANSDTGYAINGDRKQYLNGWMYEDSTLTETSKVELDCKKEKIYINDAGAGTGHNLTIPYSMIFSSTYAYTQNDLYSFIYRDSTAASSTARDLRKDKDNTYWARGSTSNYTQTSIWNNKANLDVANSVMYVTMSNLPYGDGKFVNQPIVKSNNTGKFTCGDKGQMITSPLKAFKSDVTWKDILHYDKAQYNYKDDTVDKTLSNYTMLNGIPLLIVEKNHRYIWEVEFNDTANIYVYLKYGVFDNDGTPIDSNCIKVSATEGGTKTNYATISGGAGQICFDATKNGIVFVKWRLATDANGGGVLDVANSINILDKKIDD